MSTELSDNMLPPALALVALALTFSIYLFPLYELPPIAQTFLVGAQVLVLFPADTGESLSTWSTAVVAAATLLTITWWSRQRVTRYGPWLVLLNFIYALALVGLTYHAVRPSFIDNTQGWMVSASLLSVLFLMWGALTRVWPLAVMGQVFLAIALYHFFQEPEHWTWWAMAVPLTVVFSTGRAIHNWLRVFPKATEDWYLPLYVLGRFYQLLALMMLIHAISILIPLVDRTAVFLLLGTLLLIWNIRKADPVFGIRCGFILNIVGMSLYFDHFQLLTTIFTGFAMLAFLAQPAWFQGKYKTVITQAESWALVLLSVATIWFFVSAWVVTRIHVNYLTMGWALYAVFLFFFGLLVSVRRQSLCGLTILMLAILRVLFYDSWGFSNGYKVLTYLAFTIITLGLGYLYARFGEKLKTWL